MSELPRGWVEARLGDVLEPRSEKADPSTVRDLPFLGLEDVEPYSGRVIGYGSTGDMKSSVALFSKGDLLFGRLRPYLQKILIANRDGAASAEFIVMKTNRYSHLGFFSALLRSDKFLEYTALVSSGDRPRVSYEAIADFNLALPPLAEQKRIVAKLDALNTKSARARTELARIETLVFRYKQAVLSKAFSGELTREWRHGRDWPALVRLGDVAGSFAYGSAAKSQKSGSIPVLRMGNIQNGQLDWADLVYTDDKDEIEKYRLIPGDVLFNRTNSPALVGKTAMYNGERDAIFAGYLIRIVAGPHLDARYLTYALNSPSGREFSWNAKTDGVSQSNISASKLKEFAFAAPPLEEQHEIVRRIESAFAKIDRLAKEAKRALELVGRLDEAILTKAFRGELVPQDENDEPASLLLDRIREARAGEPSRPKRRAPATKGEVHDMARTIIEALAEAKDWLAAQELFASCGVRDGSSTEDVEKLYRQLLDLERQDRVEIEEVSDPLTGAKLGNRVRLRK